MRSRAWAVGFSLCSCLLLLLSCSSVGFTQEQSEHGHREGKSSLIWSQASETTKQLAKRNFDERPILVSTLDGKISAIDKVSGKLLWTFDSEHALIQASASDTYGFSVVPGVQGELYTQEKGHEDEGFQMLPHTVPEWVENTPAVMSDGSLWLGSRHTHAFFLHPKTGKLIKSFVEYGDGFPKSMEDTSGEDDAEPILLGRVDYSVRAVDQKTGKELFNISYSNLRILDKDLKLPAFGDQPSLEESAKPSSLGITLDPHREHSILKRDPETGKELWNVQFEHPPLTLFAGGEMGMSLYGVPSWPPVEKIAAKIGMSSTPPPSILVSRIGQSYYALPLVADQQNNLKGLTQEIGLDEGDMESPRKAIEQLTSEQHTDSAKASSGNEGPIGVHILQTAMPQFTIERIVNGRAEDGTAIFVEQKAEQIGLAGMSLVGGAITAALYFIYLATEKPRVIASSKRDKYGAQVLTLSYTGTTKEAAEASRQSRLFSEAEDSNFESQIRDHTGSGYEHFPEDQAPEQILAMDPPLRTPRTNLRLGAFIANSANTAMKQSHDNLHAEGPQGRNSDSSNEPASADGKKRRKKKKPASADGGPATQKPRKLVAESETISEQTSSSENEADPQDAAASSAVQRVDQTTVANLAAETPREVVDAMLDEEVSQSVEQAKAADLLMPESTVLPMSPNQEIPGSTSLSSALRQPEWRDGTLFVGRLSVGPGIVGYGSSGTLVFEGSLDGRKVAVKRILRQFCQLARKEIAALIVADEHPNVVRCFAMEECSEFVYLALERCKQSLNDMLGDVTPERAREFQGTDGRPSDMCLKICEEVGNGLLALHESGIVHRDLKPHNVLLTEGGRTKLSDMGLCKRLTTDQTSYDSAPGGSSGWQAPEQLILRNGGQARQGKSVDIFSYGLLLHYCLTAGQHPFGEGYERDYRILNGRADLTCLKQLPEATHLIRAMLRPHPKQRPGIPAVMAHPFWWSDSRKLAFLIDISNRLETEDREVDRSLLQALEANAEAAIGGNNWSQRLAAEFLANLGKYRKYNPASLRDLLRVVRNKHNHFREMPEELQNQIGRKPEQYFRYFAQLFPNLLLTTYAFALKHCSQEPVLDKYFPAAVHGFPFTSATVANRLAQTPHRSGPTLKSSQDRSSSAPGGVMREPGLATIQEVQTAMDRSKSDTNCMQPPPALPKPSRPSKDGKARGWWSDSSQSEAASSSASTTSDRSESDRIGFLNPDDYKTSDASQKSKSKSSKSAWRSTSPEKAERPPQPPSPSSAGEWPPLPTSEPQQSSSVPPASSSKSPALSSASIPVVVPPVSLPEPDKEGTVHVDDDALLSLLKVSLLPAGLRTIKDPQGWVTVYPQRTEEGVQTCDFFAKTGSCKYGHACHFHHPVTYSVKMNTAGLPIRPNQQACPFYERTGTCKFGSACKFHHPSSSEASG